ncbi:hypothetical protein NUSPORA_01882 [Nucleospora cyclopteri]
MSQFKKKAQTVLKTALGKKCSFRELKNELIKTKKVRVENFEEKSFQEAMILNKAKQTYTNKIA